MFNLRLIFPLRTFVFFILLNDTIVAVGTLVAKTRWIIFERFNVLKIISY